MASVIDPGSSIPELIAFIRYSFLQSEFDEVRNILMKRENNMKEDLKKAVRDCEEMKKQVHILEKSKGYTELEMCNLEEKLGSSERRVKELEKINSHWKVKFGKLGSEKVYAEEKLIMSNEECEEAKVRLVQMGQEIEELRRERLSANKTIQELKAKEIEAGSLVQELQRKNVEAVQTIDELKIKSDKADEYEKDLDPRLLKLERTLAKMLSVNVEDFADLGNGNFAAAAMDVEEEENVEVNSGPENRAIASTEIPAPAASGNFADLNFEIQSQE